MTEAQRSTGWWVDGSGLDVRVAARRLRALRSSMTLWQWLASGWEGVSACGGEA